MTDSTKPGNSASATGDSPAAVQVDVQDPLPETDWFWRRTYTFLMSIIALAFVWGGIDGLYKLSKGEEIFQITRYMIGILAMLIMFYMVAPSAEQIVKLVQAARLLREGVTMNRTATVETPEAKTEVATTAGVAPEPPVAPAPRDVQDGFGKPPTQGSSARRPRSRFIDEE